MDRKFGIDDAECKLGTVVRKRARHKHDIAIAAVYKNNYAYDTHINKVMLSLSLAFDDTTATTKQQYKVSNNTQARNVFNPLESKG